jgi:hypothetical protein
MQSRNLNARAAVLRELALLRALGVSLRTVRRRPGKRAPSLPTVPPARQELLPLARPAEGVVVPAAVAARGVRGNSLP